MPGYKKGASYELKAASSRGMAAAFAPHGQLPPLPEPVQGQDKREVFNARWFRDVAAGKIEKLSLRTRSGVHEDVLAELKAEALERGATVTGLERLGLERLATHHQKTIVIDYGGTRPRAYVMGLNSVTDYWDSQDHAFNDPRRGQNFEGGATDHSAGKDWDVPSADKTTLKPYQDFACRLEGDALVAVYKNFAEAWNAAKAEGDGAGSPAGGEVNLKEPPKRLTQNLTVPCSRAQIVRTLPKKEGGERSIERLYYQASSFARHYLYIENQYFQNTDWARALKTHRQNYVQGCTSATPPVPLASIPVLHVLVVTPTPERDLMVPRTHDTVVELGHGDSMPEQDRKVRQELDQHAVFEREMAEYREKSSADYQRKQGYPTPMPRMPPPLSDLARSHQAASKGKESKAARDELTNVLRMRTLVASLWAFDDKWSQSDLPVAKRIDEEKRRYAQDLQAWKKRLATQAEDRALSIKAGGWSGSVDTPIPPAQPPDRSKELKNATAQRYREVYIHSKLMIIDDSMFTLGSANLNLRSFAVDSEINIASDDASKAKDLRQRVWKQHTKGQFDGKGDATDQEVMSETFRRWEAEASANLDRKTVGESLSSFLVKFLDERTSSIRAG
ncbi:phospholipase [Variovorax sp. IB41]|nr:phospholipase [Variovorax sp. IB41]